MLCLGVPEVRSRGDLGDDGTGIDMSCRELGDQLDSRSLLFFSEIKDGRPIRTSDVIALAIEGRRVMYLEEEFQ